MKLKIVDKAGGSDTCHPTAEGEDRGAFCRKLFKIKTRWRSCSIFEQRFETWYAMIADKTRELFVKLFLFHAREYHFNNALGRPSDHICVGSIRSSSTSPSPPLPSS